MIDRILDSKPDTDPYLQNLINSFWIVEKGANENGTIPVSEIEAYCRLFNIDDEIEDFVYLIYEANSVVQEWKFEKMKQNSKG